MIKYKFVIIFAAVTIVFSYDQFNLENQPSGNPKKHINWKPLSKIFADMYADQMERNSAQIRSDSMENGDGFSYGEVNIEDYDPDRYPHLFNYQIPREGKYARHAHNNNKLIFQSLCPTVKRPVHLNKDPQYEYRPSVYDEVICAHPLQSNIRNKVCSDVGLSCVQLNRTIFITKRLYDSQSSCWETETRVVPYGCECMWPRHQFGDIADRH